jgi:transcriptional regulator with XRE-family HTH domain
MNELGWNKAELSRRSGIPYDSINKYLRGDTENPRGNVLQVLADAIGKSLLWLRDGIETEGDIRQVATAIVAARVAGVVEAGSFREVDEFDQSVPEQIMLPRDDRFPNARLLVFDCSGNSMNDLRPRPIFPGDRLVCISYEDVEHEVELRSGMVVVVQRERDGGHFREWSVKQIELFPDRAEFHPRSTDPKHKPIIVRRDHDVDDGTTVQVIALVRRVMNEMPGF